jgi:transcriptional regulator with XRE-family HTH domain
MTVNKKTRRGRGEDALAYFDRTRGPLTLGRLLLAIRLGEEETLAVFARRLGVSKAHLSDVEHGRRAVSAQRAAAWARMLGYHEGQFVQLALQDELNAAGVRLKVDVHAA